MDRNIKKLTEMSEPVLTPQAKPTKAPPIEEVKKVVVNFLKNDSDVRKVVFTKLAQLDTEKGILEVEAEVYSLNATIKLLGLPVRKEVLDCQTHLLRVDYELNILSFGLKEEVI